MTDKAASQQKMLIIGAGPVGLAHAKSLRDHGIHYDQVEADRDLGGNWLHGVPPRTHLVTSKRTTAYPDFPMPDHYPDFPDQDQMLRYLQSYAQHFDLRERITFNTTVTWIEPDDAGLWRVHFDRDAPRLYKGVIVCNGHHWERRWPLVPGTFTGTWLHAKDFRDPEQFRDRRVLVMGRGNAACSVAGAATATAKLVRLSFRGGVWILPKMLNGRPVVDWMSPAWPVWLQKRALKVMLRATVGSYKQYGLPRPDHDILDRHPTINGEIFAHLRHGRVTPRREVKDFNGSVVTFADGQREEFDTVVCATGYRLSYPFLPESLVPAEGPLLNVYGGAALAAHRHLYLAGSFQPRYGFGPIATPAADLLARMIRLQDDLERPIGRLLHLLGERPPTSHQITAGWARGQIRRTGWRLALLRSLDRFLPVKEKTKGSAAETETTDATDDAPVQDGRPLSVY